MVTGGTGVTPVKPQRLTSCGPASRRVRGARSFGPLTCPQGLARGTRASVVPGPCSAATHGGHTACAAAPRLLTAHTVLTCYFLLSPARRQEVSALVITGEEEAELLGYRALAHLRCQPTAPGPAPAQHAHHGSHRAGDQCPAKEGRLPLVFLPSLFLTGILKAGQEEIKTFLALQASSHLSLSTAQRSQKTNSGGAGHK